MNLGHISSLPISQLVACFSDFNARQFGKVALNTWCTPGAHLVNTWCTPGEHLVNSDHMVHTQIMNTWCTPGAHLVHTW